MTETHVIDSKPLDLSIIQDILVRNKKLLLSESATKRINKCRSYLDDKMSSVVNPIY